MFVNVGVMFFLGNKTQKKSIKGQSCTRVAVTTRLSQSYCRVTSSATTAAVVAVLQPFSGHTPDITSDSENSGEFRIHFEVHSSMMYSWYAAVLVARGEFRELGWRVKVNINGTLSVVYMYTNVTLRNPAQ